MTTLELQTYINNQRKWVATRLSTIDKLLDRAAYNKENDTEELVKESDLLEQKREKLATAEKLVAQVISCEHLIGTLESRIDTLSCYVHSQSQIDELNEEIEENELEKSKLLEQIYNLLDFGNKSIKKTDIKR